MTFLLRIAIALMALIILLPQRLAAAELVMVDQPGCIWCARFDNQLGALYPKTEEGRIAPIRRIDIHSTALKDMKLAAPVRYTPTFILIEGEREVGRITGFQNEDSFWGLLSRLIRKLDKPLKTPSSPI